MGNTCLLGNRRQANKQTQAELPPAYDEKDYETETAEAPVKAQDSIAPVKTPVKTPVKAQDSISLVKAPIKAQDSKAQDSKAQTTVETQTLVSLPVRPKFSVTVRAEAQDSITPVKTPIKAQVTVKTQTLVSSPVRPKFSVTVRADDGGLWATGVALDGVWTAVPKCSALQCVCGGHKLPLPIVVLEDRSMMVTAPSVCPLNPKRAVLVNLGGDGTDPICMLCKVRSRHPLVIQEITYYNYNNTFMYAAPRCVKCLQKTVSERSQA